MEDTSNSESWTTKYNPLTIKELIGNINVIKDGVRYLKNYKSEKSAKADFHKAILISGPSGTGKTEFAKLLALYRGYIPVEFSAALLRRKQEVDNCIDIYRSDVTHNFSANHPLMIQALRNLDSCNMVKHGVGVALIIDELDATSKGYKGLITSLMTILKSTDGHNPRRVIIFTCDDNTLKSKLKTLKNQCYHLKFKQISDREMCKLIDRVCDEEHITLQSEDQELFSKFSNGDCRRLLNGMELCFKNGSHETSASDISKMIQSFVNNDPATIDRLKYSTLSTDKILIKLIETYIESDKSIFNIIPYIQTESYTLSAQLFQTYPLLMRQDINSADQMRMIAEASADISYSDYYIDKIRETSGGFDDGVITSGFFVIQGLIAPLSIMKSGIPKNFKIDVGGYAKLSGLAKSISSQIDIKTKISNSIPILTGKSFEDVRYFGSFVAKFLKEEKYEELASFFHENDIDPGIIDDLEKIKLLKSGEGDNRYLGVDLKDVWKGVAKRKFKKQYTIDTPKISGVKFKDEKTVNKICFFEQFEKPKKKQKTQDD